MGPPSSGSGDLGTVWLHQSGEGVGAMAWWSREGRDRGSPRRRDKQDAAALAALNAEGVSYFAVGRATDAIPRFADVAMAVGAGFKPC